MWLQVSTVDDLAWFFHSSAAQRNCCAEFCFAVPHKPSPTSHTIVVNTGHYFLSRFVVPLLRFPRSTVRVLRCCDCAACSSHLAASHVTLTDNPDRAESQAFSQLLVRGSSVPVLSLCAQTPSKNRTHRRHRTASISCATTSGSSCW